MSCTANFSWKCSSGMLLDAHECAACPAASRTTKKYCCSSRSSLPWTCSSFGYRTLLRFSDDDLLLDRAVVVAAVEGGEVERLGRFRLPQPQRVRGVVAVAEDRRVVRHAVDDACSGTQRTRRRPCSSTLVLGVAAELHLLRPLRPRDLPRIAEAQPLVGALDLPAVDDLLMKDAELVADAVAERRDLQRRQRIDETGREPAEAAVAEARLVFLLQQLVEVQAELGDRLRALRRRCRGLRRLLPRCGPIRNSAERYATVREPFAV